MTMPIKYLNSYRPAKYFRASYRALSDGRIGIQYLEDQLEKASFLLSEWKVIWIGTCALLRSSIDLFRVDMKSCIAAEIRREIAIEWKSIKDYAEEHAIFWEFLRKERDNVVHEYNWRAYEAWIKPDGTFRAPQQSLLKIDDDGARPALLMRGGHFSGRNSLDLLKEGADWVEHRIFDTIRRAGFDPDEQLGLVNFQPRPILRASLLTGPCEVQ
jgi:hypothetical protein